MEGIDSWDCRHFFEGCCDLMQVGVASDCLKVFKRRNVELKSLMNTHSVVHAAEVSKDKALEGELIF